MTGSERRKEIINILKTSSSPISGRQLAGLLNVSRQVIVQDMALLRAENTEIESTNTGYYIPKAEHFSRVYKVRHNDEQVGDELTSIIELGGTVEDVFVYHKVYGTIRADLHIKSKHDIDEFLNDLATGKSGLLKNVTSDYHYHTVTAPSEKLLDLIGEELKIKGYLAALTDYEPVDFRNTQVAE